MDHRTICHKNTSKEWMFIYMSSITQYYNEQKNKRTKIHLLIELKKIEKNLLFFQTYPFIVNSFQMHKNKEIFSA